METLNLKDKLKVQELKELIKFYSFIYCSKDSNFYNDKSIKTLINDCKYRIEKLEGDL
jgi:hypothetical protein